LTASPPPTLTATLATLPPPPPGRNGWPWTFAPPPLPPDPPPATGRPWPLISIVTGSRNQGEFLEETLRSVLLQGYPNLEYVVVDGGSDDGSLDILRRYAPWLAHLETWEARHDRGHAAALNRGFAHTTGDILAFLNSDDTYFPGALARIALEIDPCRRRDLVVGRCLFVDDQSRSLANEHASRAVSHRRLLAVWKGHPIPQPAAFWSRAAWTDAGPLSEDTGTPWIDYDLFCRMTRLHPIHHVDQLFATYRLHPRSITMTTRAAAAEQTLRISRQYWGAPRTLRHQTLAASLALHRLDRRGRAQATLLHARQLRTRAAGAGQAASAARTASAVRAASAASAARIANATRAATVGRRARLWAALRMASLVFWAPDLLLRLGLDRLRGPGALPVLDPATQTHVDPTRQWHDGWAGPCVRFGLEAAGGERHLRLTGTAPIVHLGSALRLRLRFDGRDAGAARIVDDGRFTLEVALTLPATAGHHTVEVTASPSFVPHTLLGNSDRRHLSWLLQTAALEP
jgi:hypothetical protein